MARHQIALEDHLGPPPPTGSYPGLVRPRDVTTLALPSAVVVRRVLVSVGDHVAAGQTVLELDDEEAHRSVRQLTFEAARAKEETTRLGQSVALLERSIHSLTVKLTDATAQLSVAQRSADTIPSRQWKDSPERAQAAYDQAVAHERRIAQLVADGVAARQELEDAQIAVRVAADDLALAKRSAEAQSKVTALQIEQARVQAELAVADQGRTLIERNGELAQARLRQAQAEAALETATSRRLEDSVKASRDGLVAEVDVVSGDRVLAGTPLLKLTTIDPMVVDVDVPPAIVNRLRRGDAVHVSLPGTSDEYNGQIVTIAPLPGDGGAHAIEVEFSNPTGALLAGRAARVRFVVNR